MNNEFYKQRRNFIIICCVIILINLSETKIESLFPILEQIKIEKLNFIFIDSYSDIFLYIFTFSFLRFFSYLKEYEKGIIKEESSGTYFPYSKSGKFFNFFHILFDKIFNKAIYDLFVPLYLSFIIIFSQILNAFSGFKDIKIATLIAISLLTILFFLIIFLELINVFFPKKIKKELKYKKETKEFNYISKNKKIDHYREIYKEKKSKLHNRKN